MFRRLSLLCLFAFAALPAHAKPARCFTTDDGYYACSFRSTDRDGSFVISAPGKPTFTMEVDQPGFGYGVLTIGDRSIPLAGQYVRGSDDPACWSNPETDVKVCAW